MPVLLHSLLRQVGLEPADGIAEAEVLAISCDSRRVVPGTLFIGLPGTQVDGGSYWRQALADGAGAAVIGPGAWALDPPGPDDAVVPVEESPARWAGRLAAAFWSYPSQRLPLIGVTGTNGKTTTTHLIEHLSAASGRPAALFGTLVNRWPGSSVTSRHTTAFADQLQADLALAAASGAQLAAMEVSSHALEQERVAGCRFAAAVFTNLTQDHLDYHPSMEAYFEAKARLFAAPFLSGGTVINIDDPWGARLADRLAERIGGPCWRSSLDAADAELRFEDLQVSSTGVEGRLITPVGSGPFSSPLVGRFNLMNLLQAVGVLAQQGLPLPLLLAAIPAFQGVPGRMERVQVGGVPEPLPAVIVDYAHTPDGLENALKACRPFTAGRLICVFGCGGDRDRSKRPLMGGIAARLADQVVVTSDNPRTEDPDAILADVVGGIPGDRPPLVEVDRARAIAMTIASARPDDLVLIAGKGHEDYQILGTRKVPFDDRVEAERALRGRLRP
jgi:UDP-N-acetylmuramoyl-L-alanyl-D-glutamate--2,6-diaminopimelate ligase